MQSPPSALQPSSQASGSTHPTPSPPKITSLIATSSSSTSAPSNTSTSTIRKPPSLTAWPATAELNRPELGYTNHPVKTTPIQNFSLEEIQKAAAEPETYDTALIFSTKWQPVGNRLNLARGNEPTDTKYFDFHRDLSPAEVAALLHGDIVWQAQRKGEWAAVLHFPRIVEAALQPANF